MTGQRDNGHGMKDGKNLRVGTESDLSEELLSSIFSDMEVKQETVCLDIVLE